MGKKIILIGPPAAGKTTIRKLFFEGENSSKLLEYALKPTYGEESLIFRALKEDIGIFDLAGQENERWLESEDKSIFQNAKSILVVVDITDELDKIVSFIDRLLEVKSEMSASANIFVLIHKIDLQTEYNLEHIKRQIKNQLKDKDIQKVFFTSIKENYFTHTFSQILEIMRFSLSDKITSQLIGSELLQTAIKTLYYIDNEVLVSREDLQLKLNLTNQEIELILDHLISKEFLKHSDVEEKDLLTLTSRGMDKIKSFSEKFHLDNLFQSDIIIKKSLTEYGTVPPFLGYFISDRDGKTMAIIELEDNLLTSIMKSTSQNEQRSQSFDIELIPMFISALEKFSHEINIKDLSDFSLSGINLKMHIFNFDRFTITLFLNPSTNIKPLEYFIKNHFIDLFNRYEEEFELFIKHGSTSIRESLKQEEEDWLEELNQRYRKDQFNVDFIDLNNAKELYGEMDRLQEKIEMHHSIEIKKVKTLKINFIKVLLRNDLKAVKRIAKQIQDLKLKYHIG
ncbi:MAG: hypothetical protein BAJALOKI2v1_250009 [Promethearchaeota archaeon]|nr:MAG: hypothetical protein BAJALOKI2v1_250009 [Candidatus Lokiarchaeota archaeon]